MINNTEHIDHALVPDNTQDILNITAGKQERSRLQLAYSRACIGISAFLTEHGVSALPSSQNTAAAGLNTVMVAVLGISVKYRKDLHRLFFTPQGRETLFNGFTHYYELSDDRLALAKQINDTSSAQLNVSQAQQALKIIETMGSK